MKKLFALGVVVCLGLGACGYFPPTPNTVAVQTADYGLPPENTDKISNGKIAAGTLATAFGDSITDGNQSSDWPTKSYRGLIAIAKGWTVTNKAISGGELADFFEGVNGIYRTTILPTSNSFALLGYNDMRHQGTTANGLLTFQREIYSALAWLAIPTSKIVFAQNAAVAYTGTWANGLIYGNAISKYSNDPGATATLSLYGTTIYIDMLQQGAASDRGFTITVDGVSYGTYVGAEYLAPATSALAYAPYLIRIPNLTPTVHTVVITVATGTAGHNAFFNWAASAGGYTSEVNPAVYVGNTLRMADYSTYAPFNQGSDAAVRQFNQIIAAAVRDLSDDGLNIAYVDACANYNIATDIYTDGVHPIDLGHSHIADAFLSAMNSIAPARGRGLRSTDWHNTTDDLVTTGSGSFAAIDQYPDIWAERIDPATGDKLSLRIIFRRIETETVTEIRLHQSSATEAVLTDIHKEIESRLRAIGK
jgi:lysophospholipase L1-like esterase